METVKIRKILKEHRCNTSKKEILMMKRNYMLHIRQEDQANDLPQQQQLSSTPLWLTRGETYRKVQPAVIRNISCTT